MDPKGPSQPTAEQAYTTPGNAADSEPAEKRAADQTRQQNKGASTVADRQPTSGSTEDATPSALGRGVRGAGPGEEAKGKTESDVGRHNELDGDQMGAPGEGKTRDAVQNKSGAGGGEGDMASDLDRKKAEQASARQDVKDSRQEKVDVAGAIGDRGGPAQTSEK